MSEPILTGASAELWQSLLRESEHRQGLRLDEDTEAYLVFLLLRHGRDAELLKRIMALEYLDAFECGGLQRVDALRDVGDRCLLLSGLFPQVSQRRRVSLRYYIDIGQGAYAAVGDLARRLYGDLFAQLATGFEGMVQVLAGIRPVAAELRLPPESEFHRLDSRMSRH